MGLHKMAARILLWDNDNGEVAAMILLWDDDNGEVAAMTLFEERVLKLTESVEVEDLIVEMLL